VEIDPASATSDLAHATGTAALNGQVLVTSLGGAYKPGAVYTILTADGGVSGTFSSPSMTSSYVFLTPGLFYDAGNVCLTLARNGTPLASLAGTPNEKAVATSLDGLPASSPLLSQVLGLTQGTNFAGLYDALSGEIHATAAGALLQGSAGIRPAPRQSCGLASRSGTRRHSALGAVRRHVQPGQGRRQCGEQHVEQRRRDLRRGDAGRGRLDRGQRLPLRWRQCIGQ